MLLNPTSRYRVDELVSRQKLEDATVLVHLGTGHIHHTNKTGTRIWELLEQGHSVAEILEMLGREFDVPPDRLRNEVQKFIDQLAAGKMIQAVDAAV